MAKFSGPAFPVLLVSTFLVLVFRDVPHVSGQTLAMHPKRLELLKDALLWLTFRRNGVLLTDMQVHDLFLETLTTRYASSKFYQTFVIAFEKGVLPRLTLKENDPCDPAYTLKYKNPWNNSVTWYYQKKFTFENYENRHDANLQYCDYRHGLVCNIATRKCQCPSGARMGPIAPDSPVKRCLLEKNQVCSLPDLDHGNDPQHKMMREAIHEMIFNLEKQESCQIGTQCRFKMPDLGLARCYDSNTDSSLWYPSPNTGLERQTLDIGNECTIGWWAWAGMCKNYKFFDDLLGTAPGYICYNFGHPRSKNPPGVVSRIGFCAHIYGSYAIAYIALSNGWEWPILLGHTNFLMGFVHRRSVPLNPEELKAYYKRYYLEVNEPYLAVNSHGYPPDQMRIKEGESCRVDATQKMEKIYRYYASLEGTPPPGQDFVAAATKKNLDAMLEETVNIMKGLKGASICKMYWSAKYRVFASNFFQYLHMNVEYSDLPPLKCVPSRLDSSNNNGICRISDDTSTRAFGKKLKEYSIANSDGFQSYIFEEIKFDESILWNDKWTACSPRFKSNPLGRQLRSGKPEHEHTSALEGGQCPTGLVCYQDYGDHLKLYDDAPKCTMRVSRKHLKFTCHTDADEIKYGPCEKLALRQLIVEETQQIDKHAKLGMGQNCDHDVENKVRSLINRDWESEQVNLYKTLELYEEGKVKGLCDLSRLLECTLKNVCDCITGTATRTVTLDGKVYNSDYCYFKSGSCTEIDVTQQQSLPISKSEKMKLTTQYGEPFRRCRLQNMCVYLDDKAGQCTTRNTGKTGNDEDGRKPTTGPGGSGLQNAGRGKRLQGDGMLICIWLGVHLLESFALKKSTYLFII